jgi:hypothetical protein
MTNGIAFAKLVTTLDRLLVAITNVDVLNQHQWHRLAINSIKAALERIYGDGNYK